jgi:hypothetical protein
VKQVDEPHGGGTITVDAVPNGGAIFAVPLADLANVVEPGSQPEVPWQQSAQ